MPDHIEIEVTKNHFFEKNSISGGHACLIMADLLANFAIFSWVRYWGPVTKFRLTKFDFIFHFFMV